MPGGIFQRRLRVHYRRQSASFSLPRKRIEIFTCTYATAGFVDHCCCAYRCVLIRHGNPASRLVLPAKWSGRCLNLEGLCSFFLYFCVSPVTFFGLVNVSVNVPPVPPRSTLLYTVPCLALPCPLDLGRVVGYRARCVAYPACPGRRNPARRSGCVR